ncbi:hypothetical protein SDC9_158079 [bioreactor metagenome]|uniref:Uncharacterized protein n=1 Tax=bioreactor metagenome TaxID=1076179 RepID=A0A645FB49_9ZZZZ
MNARLERRRRLGEDRDDLCEGVVDMVGHDQGMFVARRRFEVGANQNDARFGRLELMLVPFVADERELVGFRFLDSGDIADGAARIADHFSVNHFGDFRGGECKFFHVSLSP